jgi:predicted Fe-Mo cluster-binding NifX family protein
MKIAVPTNDGTNISEHFGRSSGFLVFQIEEGRIAGRELRSNTGCHNHDEGGCGNHAAGGGDPSHSGIVRSIAGCETVISAGMGRRAAEALKAAGINPVVAACSGPAEALVAAYLAGTLPAQGGLCQCSH